MCQNTRSKVSFNGFVVMSGKGLGIGPAACFKDFRESQSTLNVVRGRGRSSAVAGEGSCINSCVLQNTFGPFPYGGVGDWLVRLGIADEQFGVMRHSEWFRTRYVLLRCDTMQIDSSVG